MKKIILTTIAILTLISSLSFSQVKVTFSIQNARIENNNLVVDMYALVPSGQTWAVGPTNARVDYYTEPVGGITLIQDAPVANANTNLTDNTNYGTMTTTSILNGNAFSFNILLLSSRPAYVLNAGNYWLGSVRFSRSNPSACVYLYFKTNSAVFNDNTPLAYSTGWSKIDPTPCVISSVTNGSIEVPTEYKLNQNYPNPFNPTTKISFSLPKEGYVSLRVYDMLGREVATLMNDNKTAGTYIVDFDASFLSSGIYYYRLETQEFAATKKMILMK